MVIFAVATGLRPSELFGLDRRDVDQRLGVVYVRRAYADGRLKHTKTRLSTRAVPLQANALEALDRLPASAVMVEALTLAEHAATLAPGADETSCAAGNATAGPR
jgi:integrase